MRRVAPLGLLPALLALVAQLAFGAVAPDPQMAEALYEAAIICHAPSPHAPSAAAGKSTPAPHHHVPISQFCPLWTSLAAPSPVLPGAAPALPPPVASAFRHPALPPPATAPPGPVFAAQPRGPPVLA